MDKLTEMEKSTEMEVMEKQIAVMEEQMAKMKNAEKEKKEAEAEKAKKEYLVHLNKLNKPELIKLIMENYNAKPKATKAKKQAKIKEKKNTEEFEILQSKCACRIYAGGNYIQCGKEPHEIGLCKKHAKEWKNSGGYVRNGLVGVFGGWWKGEKFGKLFAKRHYLAMEKRFGNGEIVISHKHEELIWGSLELPKEEKEEKEESENEESEEEEKEEEKIAINRMRDGGAGGKKCTMYIITWE